MLNNIIDKINNSPLVQALAAIMGILGVGLITILTPIGRYIKKNFLIYSIGMSESIMEKDTILKIL